MTHEEFMTAALEMAQTAAREGEVPVGCVVTDGEGKIIGQGYNRRESSSSPCAHAELIAMEQAAKTIGDWRLTDCRLYVTLEPCPMCAGAMIMSRLGAVYYGAKEPQSGSCGSVINLFMEPYGASTAVTGGVMEKECAELLHTFFRERRQNGNNE